MSTAPWGGSEELWSQAALYLVRQGVSVAVCVHRWTPVDDHVLRLMRAGVEVHTWPLPPSLLRRAWRKAFPDGKTPLVADLKKPFARERPALVVLSDGAFVLPADLMELCLAKGWPFVTIAQANTETWWPNDQLADRYRRALQLALRCYFVSTGNLRLAEKQLGHKFNNAEVVWNPFNVRVDARPGWPSLGTDDQLRLASVGRLYPPAKGQDILLEALAGGSWAARSWRLTLYGDGSARNGLERLAEHLGLSHRVFFAGHTPDVEQIWAENHVLVMPSRVEGLPLTMVEAALCGRPVVATNIAGHSEIIDDGVTGFLADAPTARSFAGALERLWERRTDLEEIGDLAARRIREKIPADPVQVFAEKLTTLAGLTRSPTLRGRP